MIPEVRAILDWMANEKLCNETCGFTEEYYSGLINVLSEQFSINKDELFEYFEDEFESLEENWASETDVEY